MKAEQERQKMKNEQPAQNSEAKSAAPKAAKQKKMVAAILIRGLINVQDDIEDTLKMMRLIRKNCCIVIEATPSNLGMLKKTKDYITWGEIDDATLKALLDKRAEKNPRDPKKTKAFFRLNSPKKGFGRKGIKVPFSIGGALGNRGAKINDLIRRML